MTLFLLICSIEHQDVHPIQQVCYVLDIPRSTYYDSHHKTFSNRERENNELIQRITEIHKESKKRYGASKIHHLGEEGYKASIKHV